MVLDPIPQSLPVHFFGSRPQPPTFPIHCNTLQGGEDPQDALSCRSFFAKEPLIIGLFCGKRPVKIRHSMGLRHPVMSNFVAIYCIVASRQLCLNYNMSLQYTATHYEQFLFKMFSSRCVHFNMCVFQYLTAIHCNTLLSIFISICCIVASRRSYLNSAKPVGNIYMSMYIYIYIYIHIYVCVCVCAHVCQSAVLSRCICVCYIVVSCQACFEYRSLLQKRPIKETILCKRDL